MYKYTICFAYENFNNFIPPTFLLLPYHCRPLEFNFAIRPTESSFNQIDQISCHIVNFVFPYLVTLSLAERFNDNCLRSIS